MIPDEFVLVGPIANPPQVIQNPVLPRPKCALDVFIEKYRNSQANKQKIYDFIKANGLTKTNINEMATQQIMTLDNIL